VLQRYFYRMGRAAVLAVFPVITTADLEAGRYAICCMRLGGLGADVQWFADNSPRRSGVPGPLVVIWRPDGADL
jgi:hypothetical protein